jgi:hypothetical protein
MVSNTPARRYSLGAAFVLALATFAWAANPVPTVTGPVQPQAVVPGGEAFALTVYGANFVSGATVNWNRKPRSTTFVSARELKAKILASDIAKPTAGFISVTNPAPGGGVSSSSYGLVDVHEPTSKISLSGFNNYMPGDIVAYLVTADFNNDGILDIAAGDGASIFLYLGNGDGTFRLGSTVTNNFLGDGGHFAYGDFNGDGDLDLAFVSGQKEGPLNVTVVLGNGDGTFRPGSIFGNFTNSAVLVVGDFNRDGKLDVVVGALEKNGTGFYFFVFLGKGNGSFKQQIRYPIGHPYFLVATADLNGDGVLDLIFYYIPDGLHNAIGWMLGKGDGTFGKARTLTQSLTTCGFAPPFALDDFNGDGKIDLAYSDCNRIGVQLGKGNGSFGKPKFYSIPDNQCAMSFAAGDFTSDNKSDLLVSYCHFTHTGFKDASEFFLGNGDGSFQKKRSLKIPGGGFAGEGIIPGDFDANGLLDFVFEFPLGGFRDYLQR